VSLAFLIKPASVESPSEEEKGSFPPLGLLYLASVFREHGCDVELYDLDFTGEDELLNRACSKQPDIIAITSVTPSYWETVRVIRRLREALEGALIAVGGPHATLVSEDFFGLADIVVRGEGEGVVEEIIKLAKERGGRRSETIVLEGRPIEDLDSLPYPDRSVLRPELYSENIGSMFTSRGCPYNCLFCVTRYIMGSRFRARSPENVVGEWAKIIGAYRVPEVKILDDVFTFDRGRATAICKLALEYGLGKWSLPNGVRVDNVDPDLLALMAESGCTTLWYGVESGSQRVLKLLRKGITLEQVERAVRWSKDVGIEVGLFFMVGAPGENLDTVRETLDLIARLDPNYVHFSIATPYPRTDFWRWVEENGRFLTRDYSRFEREFVFETPDYSLRDRLKAVEIIEDELAPKYGIRILHAD